MGAFRLGKRPEVGTGELPEGSPLFFIYGGFSRRDIVCSSGLDLHEAKAAIMPRNEVDIAAISGACPSTSNNGVPSAAEFEENGTLSQQAGLQMGCDWRTRNAVKLPSAPFLCIDPKPA